MKLRCGRCHTCGEMLRYVLDGEEWCNKCKQYRRYPSHGWARGTGSNRDTECPNIHEKVWEWLASPEDET